MATDLRPAKPIDPGIDFVRATAGLMVVVLHVAAANFPQFGEKWWATNFYDSLVRPCVPLFLMVSGAVLLRHEDSLPLYLRKRYVRILPPLIFWSLVYMTWNAAHGAAYGDWRGWLKAFASGPVSYHLWYLYLIVGLYLFVPFLRKIYLHSSPLERNAFLLLWFAVAAVWPVGGTLLKLKTDVVSVYGLYLFSGFAGYLFLGAYLFDLNRQPVRPRRWFLLNILAYTVCSAATMAGTYWYSTYAGAPSELFYLYLAPFVVVAAAAAFNLLYALGWKAEKYSGGVRALANGTLGIYCIHVLVLDRIAEFTGLTGAAGNPWWSIPATTLLGFGASFVIVWLMRALKPLRWVT